MTTPSTTIERLSAWAGPDFGVNPWHLVKVQGVEFYYLANTVQYRGVAVVPGQEEPLTGAGGFRAMRERGVSDPWELAALALHFLGKGGTPLRNAEEAKNQPADVMARFHAPRVQGNTLEFWGWDQRASSLVRFQVDLATQTMSSVAGGQLAAADKDPIDLAKQRLAGTSDTVFPGAIDMLVAACADPRAPAALNDVIRSHPNAGAREWAAFQAAKCKDGQTVAALIHALEKDTAAGVRKNAADTLGKLAAGEARAALERAQNDPDVSVRGAVGRALKKLP